MNRAQLVVGIDVGTGGVRLSGVDTEGKLHWSSNISLNATHRSADGIHEQDPEEWWSAICRLSQRFTGEVNQEHVAGEITAISVTSTSGTLVPVDKFGDPVRHALLYDDQRSNVVAEQLTRNEPSGGTRWTSSHSLSKAIWVRDAEPEVWERVARLLHPTDWLIAKLSGDFCVADHSNVLKLGYDAEERRWSPSLGRFGVPPSMLPSVVKSGTLIGRVCLTARVETGLPDAAVIAGTTDGIAGLIASGASLPTDANTTLGTTLVWKVLSIKKPMASDSAIYAHLHPAGLWAPGAASNTGPGSVRPPNGLSPSEELDNAALEHLPSEVYCYPISGQGERFPFVNNAAQGFAVGVCTDEMSWYAAQLQAIAFVERWGYEVLEKCGVSIGPAIFSTGRAASSGGFSRLRASVLKRIILRSAHPDAAFGAAVLAASAVHYGGNLLEAIRSMTHISGTYAPTPVNVESFDRAYGRFREECHQRGYGSCAL